jgi:CubicO group peptidase (beta-lactamase class C family)
MAEIHGEFDVRFEPVRDVLAANLDSGADVGASVAVSLDGELVVDIWGGFTDEAKTTPWERDTITNVWSSTKTVTALCALILADRGELDVDAPVARYWPEFAANGKEGVLVRHLLGHTAGLSGWAEPVTIDDICDWEKATSLLAAQAPWWEPGTASGYHALTQGYLVGEVVRRITGQSLGTFVAKEVAGPLGADFHVGLPPEADHRVANVIPPPPLQLPENPPEIMMRTLGNPPLSAEWSWTEMWRRAEIPAANGHGNARSLATIQAVLAGGGEAGGVRLMSPSGGDIVFREQARGVDLVLGVPLCLGIGFGINSSDLPISPNPRSCFWGGWGGSIVIVDLDARLVVTYMMNRMGEGTVGDERGMGLLAATYGALAAG